MGGDFKGNPLAAADIGNDNARTFRGA